MGRRQTAQIDMEEPETIATESRKSEPARRTRAKAEARTEWRVRARKWAFWSAVGFAALAAIAAVYQADQYLASNSHFVLTGNLDTHPNLTISGARYASKSHLSAVFAEDFGRSIYLLPVAERRRALMRIDWIRDASVTRRWPNRVAVRVYERAPVAFAMLPQSRDASGTMLYEAALVDGEGVILNPPARARFELPVLYGITRQQTPQARKERVRQVLELLAEVKSHTGKIAEINASDPDNLTITYSAQGRAVRLMLGNQRYLSRLQNYLSNSGEIGRRLPNARLFDLRLDDRITAVEGGADAR